MNKIKCLNCGITNWASAEQCIKCKQILGIGAPRNYTYQPENSLEDKASFSFGGIAIILIVGVFGMFFVWNSMSKSSQKTTAVNDGADGSQSDYSIKEVAIAAPPADFNVVAPDLKNFSDLVRTEIENNNRGVIERSSELFDRSTGSPNDIRSPLTGEQMDKAVTSRYGSDCSRDFSQCKERIGNQVYQVTPAEMENTYRSIKETQTTVCKPTIQESAVAVKPGFYHKFEKEVFFVTDVRAKGLEGYVQNNECKTRPAIADLNATVYLKWVNARWQASNQIELNQASRAFNTKQKEITAERVEKEREAKDKLRF